METHDGLHLPTMVFGPDDASLTMFLTHCWTLNLHYWQYQVGGLLRELGHGIRIVTGADRGHHAPDAGNLLPLERDQLFSGVLTRLSRTHM
jgi:hypothetical protein